MLNTTEESIYLLLCSQAMQYWGASAAGYATPTTNNRKYQRQQLKHCGIGREGVLCARGRQGRYLQSGSLLVIADSALTLRCRAESGRRLLAGALLRFVMLLDMGLATYRGTSSNGPLGEA